MSALPFFNAKRTRIESFTTARELLLLIEKAAFREMICSDTAEEREVALARILPYRQGDFEKLYETLEGNPVCIRFLAPRPTVISSAQRAGYHQRKALHIIRDEVAAYHQPNRAGYHQRKALYIIRDEVAAYHQPKGLDITNAERCISSATKLRHIISPVGWISPRPTRNRNAEKKSRHFCDLN